MTGGRFEAALDFLAKQQQNEAVNGLTKVPSSGKYNSTCIYFFYTNFVTIYFVVIYSIF